MNLVNFNDITLRTSSNAVEPTDLPDQNHINDMIDLAETFCLPVLTANQVGDPRQYFIMKMEHGWSLFCNPSIKPIESDTLLIHEMCPHTGLQSVIRRARRVQVNCEDQRGNQCEFHWTGADCYNIQLVCDYLSGNDLSHLRKLGDWGCGHVRY